MPGIVLSILPILNHLFCIFCIHLGMPADEKFMLAFHPLSKMAMAGRIKQIHGKWKIFLLFHSILLVYR